MDRFVRIKAMQVIAEKLNDRSENNVQKNDRSENNVQKNDKDNADHEYKEMHEYNEMYDTFKNTPAGSFEINDDKNFQKAFQVVLADIQNTFKNQPNVDNIVQAFKQAVDAKNKNEIKNAFNLISKYKEIQKNTEKQAFEISKQSLLIKQ